jgi:hypothetical protein
MRSAIVSLAALWFLSVASPAVFAKNVSIGIYGVIERLTFEPSSEAPTLVRISGVFVVPVPVSSGEYRAPQRGYIYFRARLGLEEECRRDWSAFEKAAGTGQVVGFTQYWVPNPNDPSGNPHYSLEVTVHGDDAAASPDPYPLPHRKGVVMQGDKSDPDFDKIAAQLLKAAHH